jgi:ribosomal protein S18 acetylase RimI-like enzyme
MGYTIREMTIDDYDDVFSLWTSSEGVGLSDADSRERITEFLDQNIGLSFVAISDNRIIGTVLCGHDGRRGYINHLVVDKSFRRKGIGKALAERSIQALHDAGFTRCHIFIFKTNQSAIDFWKKINWFERVDLVMMSKDI